MGSFMKNIAKNNQVADKNQSLGDNIMGNPNVSSKCKELQDNFNDLDNKHRKIEKDYDELNNIKTDIQDEKADLEKYFNTYKGETMNTLEAKAAAQNKELARAFSTHSSKSMYQTEQIASLNWYVYYLLWLYAVVAVIFLVALFGGPNANKTSIYVKGIVTVLILLYPFYVTTVENFLYAFYQFGLHIIYGDVYIQSSY